MKRQLAVKEICVISIFTAITAVLAQIAVPLPFTPVPFSLGMVGIYITGMLLSPKNAILAMICYLLLGAAGVPVFGNFRGGLSALFGPTGGCLMVYPLMAAVISFTLNSKKSLEIEDRQGKIVLYLKTSAALCIAITMEYLGGAAWLAATVTNSFYGALALVCFPFIPLDILKIIFCVALIIPFRSRLMSMNMLLFKKNRTKEKQTKDSGISSKEKKGILEKALAEEKLSPDEAKILIDPKLTPLEELMKTADTITRRHFENEIGICSIYPAKVGKCSGDCAFCAQSAHHSCDVRPVYVSELKAEELAESAKELRKAGVKHYSLVTSGEHLTDDEFEHILEIFRRLKKETDMGLCASLGSLTADRASKLKDAGVSRYHHNIETSRSFFPEICSTHSYDDKINTIKIAQEAGMQICCGGIIAMGETFEQRIEMAFALKELNVDCVPINILNPIAGTRLQNQEPLSSDEILRTVSIFRLIMPNKNLKLAGGREKALGKDEYKGYKAGINSILAGNYLTTIGKNIKQEIEGLKALGYKPEK